jgi:hypothetical protein
LFEQATLGVSLGNPKLDMSTVRTALAELLLIIFRDPRKRVRTRIIS